jgi:hypothetical protein
MDVNKLIDALDNDKNETIINLTTKKILEMNLNILKELHLDRNTTLDYLKKLKGYRYIDEINDLKYGGYIRWIPITDPTHLPLHQCGIVCDIVITDTGVNIVCKNFMHRHYRFKMDECLIFQKLSAQELIILSALDHLEDKNVINNTTNLVDEEDEEEYEEEDEENDEY